MIDLRKYLQGIEGVATALEAMCNGLKYQNSREDFTIDMFVFGKVREGMCFGCAATCALQDIAGINFVAGTIDLTITRYKAGNFSRLSDVDDFEDAIDSARHGKLYRLYKFCGVGGELGCEEWALTTENWKQELPIVRRYIKKIMKDSDLEWGDGND